MAKITLELDLDEAIVFNSLTALAVTEYIWEILSPAERVAAVIKTRERFESAEFTFKFGKLMFDFQNKIRVERSEAPLVWQGEGFDKSM